MREPVYYRTDAEGTIRALTTDDLRGVLERLDPALPLESCFEPVLSVAAQFGRVYVTNACYQQHMKGEGGTPMTVGNLAAALVGVVEEAVTMSFLGSLYAVRVHAASADGEDKAYVELDHEGVVLMGENRIDLSGKTAPAPEPAA